MRERWPISILVKLEINWLLNKSPLWDVTVMNEGWLHLGKGGVAFWIESTELNCPRKLGQEPGMVQRQRTAKLGWSVRRVGAGGHAWQEVQGGGL